MLRSIGVLLHGPELEERELPHVHAEARLAEERRARRVSPDEEGDHGHDRCCEDEEDRRDGDVDTALHEPR